MLNKILIVSMKHGYGDPNQPLSYEWNHFYLSLRSEFDVDFFDFMEETALHGKLEMQKNLLELVRESKPDLIFFVLYTDQFDQDFILELRKYSKVCGFFHDDNWRQDFVRAWGPAFDVFTTSDNNGVEKYAKLGHDNAYYFPFGANEKLFKPDVSVNQDIEVSFIGAWHPYREWLIKKLKKSGVNIQVYGNGWNNGSLSELEMVEIMQRSKICLNLSNSINYDVRYLLSSPRAIINTLRSPKNKEQIKGRHFEIPACGSLQVSYYVEGLEKLFNIGEEIVIFTTVDDLIDKITYYLMYEQDRKKIAAAGLNRLLAEHTYKRRFELLQQNLH